MRSNAVAYVWICEIKTVFAYEIFLSFEFLAPLTKSLQRCAPDVISRERIWFYTLHVAEVFNYFHMFGQLVCPTLKTTRNYETKSYCVSKNKKLE